MKPEEIAKAKSYQTTEAMKNAARRGLELREKYGRGGLDTRQASEEGVGSGVARARDIIEGSLSLDSVKRMAAFFSRHEKNYNPGKKEADGGPTAGTISFYLWGGSSGRAWSNAIVNREEKVNKFSINVTEQLTKATEPFLKQVTYVAMRANTTDAQGDFTSLDDVRKAKESFNKALKKKNMANLMHLYKTDSFEVIESYISLADMQIGDNKVNRGDWLITLYVADDNLFDSILKGEFVGLSIGARAKVEYLDKE